MAAKTRTMNITPLLQISEMKTGPLRVYYFSRAGQFWTGRADFGHPKSPWKSGFAPR